MQRRYIIRINSGAHGGAPGMFTAPGQSDLARQRGRGWTLSPAVQQACRTGIGNFCGVRQPLQRTFRPAGQGVQLDGHIPRWPSPDLPVPGRTCRCSGLVNERVARPEAKEGLDSCAKEAHSKGTRVWQEAGASPFDSHVAASGCRCTPQPVSGCPTAAAALEPGGFAFPVYQPEHILGGAHQRGSCFV